MRPPGAQRRTTDSFLDGVDGLAATLGGRRGILVPPEDLQALPAALERVLRERPWPLPLRNLAERHAPARVAAIYESTYCRLVRPRVGTTDGA